MVDAHYDHIWDCCCDHGLLGAALLATQTASCIHFVDIVPELMHTLEQKLARFFAANITAIDDQPTWQVHCMDVSHVPLQEIPGKHLVIIAGVGGDLMAELVTTIRHQNPMANVDFLLCPVHHQFTLRQQLIQLGFSLKAETLVVENRRFYEVILISSDRNNICALSPVGNAIWQGDTHEKQKVAIDYLAKTLGHYKRMQLQKNNTGVQQIIDAYSAVAISLAKDIDPVAIGSKEIDSKEILSKEIAKS
jgi:tRNA (adenine22-N1)-methyltransferase